MKDRIDHSDRILNELISSTRSPRGRFSAKRSWKLLEERLLVRRKRRILWKRAASSAAVVLLCVASWATYHALYLQRTHTQPTEVVAPSTPPAAQREILYFEQQPLQEIARQLSSIFGTKILITDDSLRHYRMTGTFGPKESLPQILDLLKDAAGNFDYTYKNDTVTIIKLK